MKVRVRVTAAHAAHALTPTVLLLLLAQASRPVHRTPPAPLAELKLRSSLRTRAAGQTALDWANELGINRSEELVRLLV